MVKKKSAAIEDKEDLEMIAAYERGEFTPVRNQAAVQKMLQQAAINTRLKKDARVNIRMNGWALDTLKALAEDEGLPYQTLLASILFKHARIHATAKHGRK